MLDFWGDTAAAGTNLKLRVAAINDLDAAWGGTVRLRLLNGETVLAEESQNLAVPPLGEAEAHFEITLPDEPMPCTLEASLMKGGEPEVRSLRRVRVEVKPSGHIPQDNARKSVKESPSPSP